MSKTAHESGGEACSLAAARHQLSYAVIVAKIIADAHNGEKRLGERRKRKSSRLSVIISASIGGGVGVRQ